MTRTIPTIVKKAIEACEECVTKYELVKHVVVREEGSPHADQYLSQYNV